MVKKTIEAELAYEQMQREFEEATEDLVMVKRENEALEKENNELIN